MFPQTVSKFLKPLKMPKNNNNKKKAAWPAFSLKLPRVKLWQFRWWKDSCWHGSLHAVATGYCYKDADVVHNYFNFWSWGDNSLYNVRKKELSSTTYRKKTKEPLGVRKVYLHAFPAKIKTCFFPLSCNYNVPSENSSSDESFFSFFQLSKHMEEGSKIDV